MLLTLFAGSSREAADKSKRIAEELFSATLNRHSGRFAVPWSKTKKVGDGFVTDFLVLTKKYNGGILMQLKDILTNALSTEEFYNSVKERHRKLVLKRGVSVKDQAAYIAQKLPRVKVSIIEEAEEALKGMMILPGTGAEPYDVGNPPNWFNNPVNHNEYVFHLNRMNHWKPLLEAYTLTGDRRYAEKVVQELNNWVDKCQRPSIEKDPEAAYKSFNSVNPWRSLEAGIRNFKTWPWVIEHLLDTDIMTPELLEKYAVSVYEQGEVLAEICPIFWPKADHNHYLMENLGLLSLSCLFPEFKTSEQWRAHALRELERCAAEQITEDGGQIEGCPSYHNGCVFWFSLSLLIAREHGIKLSENYINRVRNSLDYSIYSFRPSGTLVPWGDSNTNKGMINSAFFGYLAFNSFQWLSFATKLVDIEEIKRVCIKEIWRIKDMDVLLEQLGKLEYNENDYTLPTVSWQRGLKQVAMRTDWTRDALSVLFACRTPIQNNHAHIDPMGFDFTAYGRPLVVDPGKFTYKEDENRKNFKSAEWHNTLTIDGKPPFEYISSWRYGPQKHGNILKVGDRKELMYAEAEHLNYEPAVHRRLLSIVDGTFLLVLDRVTKVEPDASVQIYYHMDTDKAVLDLKNGCAYTESGSTDVVIYASGNLRGELLPAKISEANDIGRDSVRLCLRDHSKGSDTRNYVSVIVPYRQGTDVPQVTLPVVEEKGGKFTCRFTLDEKEYSFIWDDKEFVKV